MTSVKKTFDPDGPGNVNAGIFGLPYSFEEAQIVILPAPWEVTVSYREGAASAAHAIKRVSSQLDLAVPELEEAWKLPIYMPDPATEWEREGKRLRRLASEHIRLLESGHEGSNEEVLNEINQGCDNFRKWIFEESSKLIRRGKLVGLVGGDHSTPLGLIQALGQSEKSFGILQIDAHADLRNSFEGFQLSHASIMFNALKTGQIERLVQVGIRDICQEEIDLTAASNGRIKVYSDWNISSKLYNGELWSSICDAIVYDLPEKVYISFDIDGLDPNLCPGTGTPVPGGLSFNQVLYLMDTLVRSGRTIIGFDLCEVSGTHSEWDAIVGARVLYRLCTMTAQSHL